uniref:Subtilisin-like protease C1 n=1 Tax=Glycine max TaxID=3847 RepID=Q9ZTT3_SOYBN|nr:subtilisin-like protease C1 [Glycine max]AAN12272.1 subtilisin-like protease C1 [Glycine max]
MTMDTCRSSPHLLMLLCFASFLQICHSASQLKSYIVYTGNSMNDEASALTLYSSMLQEVADSNAEPKLVQHHFKRSFSGFVAMLTEEEADRMARHDRVVAVFPNKKKQLHTTRSWDFIGFPLQANRAPAESDVIIAVFDSGIWPESESFNDKGFGPPPSKWKGTCQTSKNFTCNNKIIGAKIYKVDGFFSKDDPKSVRDIDGHGTHVASTAAGNPVSTASMLGLGQGTSRGGVTKARIAVYKVCWFDGCTDADILAAFDDAIADGVDIITVSLGGFSDENYFRDGIAIGAFHAVRNGVLTVTSAGNSGPRPSSLSNFSPWSISVAASTIDRKFVTKVELGNKITYEGTSINTFDLKGELYPIIYGGDAPNKGEGIDGSSSRYCSSGSLDKKLVKGKIVLCESRSKALGPFDAGAVGALIQGQGFRDLPPSLPLPGSYLALQDGASVYDYINSTRTPIATIFKTDETKDTIAPVVASFSSRGPNIVTPEILKPDLVAPGVSILASWSPASPPSDVEGDNRTLNFNIISGTSMACPHVSGAAAYVKSFHPTWSPAAIRSALMTTAKQLSPKTHLRAEFAYGAGQIDPSKAVYPGLVYDAGEIDYVRFLCGQGYSTRTLQLITGDNSSCPETKNGSARDLNYASFALFVPPYNSNSVSGSFNRTVTNVGSPKSTYKATVTSPKGLKIEVNPSVLPFTSLNQKQTFVLTITGKLEGPIVSGSLVWDDGKYQVRSPIVVFNTA